jgi:para-nitrobenzyl esterase
MTEAELGDTLVARYGDFHGARLKQVYREHFPDKSPYLRYAQIITDAGFRRFAHAQAQSKAARRGAPVYSYLWEWVCPAYDGKFGAVHAMDVSASMHNERDAILGSGSADARRMCEMLGFTLLAFAKTGNPDNPHIPAWPCFDSSHRATLVLDRDIRIENDPHGALRKLWLDMPPGSSVFG